MHVSPSVGGPRRQLVHSAAELSTSGLVICISVAVSCATKDPLCLSGPDSVSGWKVEIRNSTRAEIDMSVI